MVFQRASRVQAAALRSNAFNLLDRIEVRTVSRHVEDARADRVDRFPNALDLMCGEVVHHHNVAWRERRSKRLLDIGAEGIAGHRTIDDERGDDAGAAQAGDDGGRPPVAERRKVDHALALRPPAVATHHVGRSAGLVEEQERGRV